MPKLVVGLTGSTPLFAKHGGAGPIAYPAAEVVKPTKQKSMNAQKYVKAIGLLVAWLMSAAHTLVLFAAHSLCKSAIKKQQRI